MEVGRWWIQVWFYVNGTLEYDKVFVFYSPKESLFWIWPLQVLIFEGPESVCPFHQHGPTLCSGVLLVMHFDTPKDSIRLEAWFYVNGTLKYDKVFVFYSQNGVFNLNLALASSNFWKLKVRVPFSSAQQSLLSCVLLVMHFGTSKVLFIRLKAWFYVNGTLKYDKICFLFPNGVFILILAFASSNF